jgi:hypothetical protein
LALVPHTIFDSRYGHLGHTAHLTANGSEFPYIPQWIVIFMLLLMFAVDLYQNWWAKKHDERTAPVHLHHRIDKQPAEG